MTRLQKLKLEQLFAPLHEKAERERTQQKIADTLFCVLIFVALSAHALMCRV